MLAVVALAIALTSPAPSWAADYPGNQAIDQPASLVAPEPDAKITIYLRPEASKSRIGYGANGDAVTVLEKVSDNQSVTWNHIRFDNPPHAEGWVQEEFTLLKGEESPGQPQQIGGNNRETSLNENRYLGNQQLSAGEAALTQSGQSQFGQSPNQQSQFNQSQPRQSPGQQSQFNQSQPRQSPGQQSQFSRQNSRQSYSHQTQN